MRRRTQAIIETLTEGAIRVCGIASIVFVVLIIVFLLRDALPILRTVPLGELLSGSDWRPTATPPHFGFLPLILGSLLVTVGALVIAIPFGVGCAAFIAEVLPAAIREVVKPIVELLAAVPSVVFGFVGLTIIGDALQTGCAATAEALPGPDWLTSALNMPTGMAAITGAVVLALMALPTIVSISEDAINAVPRSYREGSWALGATRWQTISRVTLPAAKSGIIAAVMLGVGRTVGETMAVLMVTGNAAVMPSLAAGMFRPVRTMTATIAAEMGETAHMTEHYHALFMLGVVLFVVTFAANTAADVVSHRDRHVEHR